MFDPGFKSFNFLPNSTSADSKFKRDLLNDLPGWLETLAHTNSEVTQPSSPVAESVAADEDTIEPIQNKAKSFFGSMRDNAHHVMPIGDATLSCSKCMRCM